MSWANRPVVDRRRSVPRRASSTGTRDFPVVPGDAVGQVLVHDLEVEFRSVFFQDDHAPRVEGSLRVELQFPYLHRFRYAIAGQSTRMGFTGVSVEVVAEEDAVQEFPELRHPISLTFSDSLSWEISRSKSSRVPCSF